MIKETFQFLFIFAVVFSTIVLIALFANYLPGKTTTSYESDNLMCIKEKGWGLDKPSTRCYNCTPINN